MCDIFNSLLLCISMQSVKLMKPYTVVYIVTLQHLQVLGFDEAPNSN